MASLPSVVRRASAAAAIAAALYGCGLGLGGEDWFYNPGGSSSGSASPEGGTDATAKSSGDDAGEDAGGDSGDDIDSSDPGGDGGSTVIVIGPGGQGPSPASDAGPDGNGADDDAGPSPTCTKLSMCCPLLQFVSSGSALPACDSAVSSNDVSSCQSFLTAFQAFGLCF